MRYQIPQFIEIEDKIIGPFTLKQFLALISVPAFCYFLHFFARLPYVILVGVIFFPITLLLFFFKINGRSFTQVMGGMLKFVAKPQTYIWKQVPQPVKRQAVVKKSSKKQASSRENKIGDFKKLARTLDEEEV